MILEIAAVATVAAGALAFGVLRREQFDIHKRIDSWADRTRTEHKTLSTSLVSLKSDLGFGGMYSDFSLRPARYRDIDGVRAEIAQLADALGLVREHEKHVPARFVVKGGPDRE